VKVTFFDCQKTLKLNKREITKLVKALLSYLNVECNEIILNFVDKKKISEIHLEFFNDGSPTDCITFPIDDEFVKFNRILGEIFVCPDIAVEYASKHSLDSFEEVFLYIVHGILHLIGYDDIQNEDRIIMKKKEKECMAFLKQMNLISDKN
jgi:probable rRNA maturation factor